MTDLVIGREHVCKYGSWLCVFITHGSGCTKEGLLTGTFQNSRQAVKIWVGKEMIFFFSSTTIAEVLLRVAFSTLDYSMRVVQNTEVIFCGWTVHAPCVSLSQHFNLRQAGKNNVQMQTAGYDIQWWKK